MIHYHGLPITPEMVVAQAMFGAHFFVSFEYPDQLSVAAAVASSFAVDNGAFSRWKSGHPVKDWAPYYEWLKEVSRLPSFDFAVIPDVIDGDEDSNDVLVSEWPFDASAGAPVWHLHESLGRLARLCARFPRICIGSSGAFAKIGTLEWWRRMGEAMEVACYKDGIPKSHLHGLRMMDPEVVAKFPFKSVDSTNIAQNIGIDCRWKGTYKPPTKAARAAVMRSRIEAIHSPDRWTPVPVEVDELLAGF